MNGSLVMADRGSVLSKYACTRAHAVAGPWQRHTNRPVTYSVNFKVRAKWRHRSRDSAGHVESTISYIWRTADRCILGRKIVKTRQLWRLGTTMLTTFSDSNKFNITHISLNNHIVFAVKKFVEIYRFSECPKVDDFQVPVKNEPCVAVLED